MGRCDQRLTKATTTLDIEETITTHSTMRINMEETLKDNATLDRKGDKRRQTIKDSRRSSSIFAQLFFL